MKIVEKIFRDGKYYITSGWGNRTYWLNGKKVTDFHDGIDYGTNNKKLAQYAVEDGYIVNCGIDYNYGNAKFVWVAYPRIGKKFLHYHLDSIAVTKNQKVTKNTILGYTGTTGYSTGIHLHLGMKDINGGSYQNPESYDYKEEVKVETKLKYNKGDKIVLNGYLYRDSAGNGKGAKKSNHKGTITIVSKGAKKPYHIDSLGWVAESDIKKQSSSTTYTVKQGDNLSTIGAKFGVDWKVIAKNNNIKGPKYTIYPGQKLVIK